jgi:hypothetical protein
VQGGWNRDQQVRDEEQVKVDVHNETLLEVGMVVVLDEATVVVASRLDGAGPEDVRDIDEQSVVGDIATDTDATTETVGEVSLALGVGMSGLELALIVQETLRAEAVKVFAVKLRVTVHGPNVEDDEGTLGDEVALVDVVLSGLVLETDGVDRAPAENLADDGTAVRHRLVVLEVWHAVVANNIVDLLLSLTLDLGVGGHGKEEPGHDSSSGLGTSRHHDSGDPRGFTVGELVFIATLDKGGDQAGTLISCELRIRQPDSGQTLEEHLPHDP